MDEARTQDEKRKQAHHCDGAQPGQAAGQGDQPDVGRHLRHRPDSEYITHAEIAAAGKARARGIQRGLSTKGQCKCAACGTYIAPAQAEAWTTAQGRHLTFCGVDCKHAWIAAFDTPGSRKEYERRQFPALPPAHMPIIQRALVILIGAVATMAFWLMLTA